MRRTALLFHLALCLLAGGCLYLPPVTHTADRGKVLSIQPGVDTRQSLRRKLGKPNVLDLAAVQAWDWSVNKGTFLVLAGPGSVLDHAFKGDAFRVLARFEGERVSAVEHFERAKEVPESAPSTPPAPDPIAEERGGRRFELDRTGRLWLKDAEHPERTQVLPAVGPEGTQLPLALAVSPDGRSAVVLRAGEARVWDTGLGTQTVVPAPGPAAGKKPRAWMPPHARALFSEDGRSLLLSDPQHGLRMVEVATWQVRWAQDATFGLLSALAPDGSRVLIPDAGLTVLDGATGAMTGRIEPRGLERWFNFWDNHWWLDFALRFLSSDTFLACGTATAECWSLPEIERAFRDRRPVRVHKGGLEPALLAVDLRPFPDVLDGAPGATDDCP